MSLSDYRAYADECFDWARTARSQRERDIFLQMANTWLQAALLVEACKKDGGAMPAYSGEGARSACSLAK